MRRALPALATLAWPVVAAASAATTHDVAARNNAFDPATITIGVGDSVRWTNRDLVQHSVTFRGQESGDDLLPTETTTQDFPTAGTYRYFCRFHSGMEGTVLVRGTSASTNRSTTTTTEAPLGSARSGTPEGSTTTTTTTTSSTVPVDDTTTTTVAPGGEAAAPPVGGDDDDPSVDLPAIVAALLLLGAGGGAFYVTRSSLG